MTPSEFIAALAGARISGRDWGLMQRKNVNTTHFIAAYQAFECAFPGLDPETNNQHRAMRSVFTHEFCAYLG